MCSWRQRLGCCMNLVEQRNQRILDSDALVTLGEDRLKVSPVTSDPVGRVIEMHHLARDHKDEAMRALAGPPGPACCVQQLVRF